MKKTLADRLRAEMSRAGLTAYRLWQLSGVGASQIGKILRGEQSEGVSVGIVARLAAALGVTLDALVPRVELPEAPPVLVGGRKKNLEKSVK